MAGDPLALGVLLLAPLASGQAEESPLPENEEIRAVWERLSARDRHEVAEWVRLELSFQDTFQRGLLRFAREGLEVDPGLLPPAAPTPSFDPSLHAPGQPIPRRHLAHDDERAQGMRRRLLGRDTVVAPAWIYDWSSGEVRRAGDPDDPELVFENALAGLPPGADLARALVLAALDGGEERAALTAFAHAYSDRDGNVYPGVTLYDAWSSGEEIEMPDVDVLGVVHDVLDEWRKWKAPVPPSGHRRLYAAVGEVFSDARRYRGLREVLADCWISGTPDLPEGYGANLVHFHALWEEHGSDPHSLTPVLPDAGGWERFLKRWNKESARNKDLQERANGRWATLLADNRRVRATLVWVLREYETLAAGGSAPGGGGGR